MSFLRHREIYRSDREARSGVTSAPGAHRLDESPAGYSSAGCPPAEPASASPAIRSLPLADEKRYDLTANGQASPVSLSHLRGAAQALHSFPSPISPSGRSRSVVAAGE